MITNFNHFFDDVNKIDIVMSISAENCNIKLWNLYTWEIILFLKNIYLNGCLFSACFITDNNNYNYEYNCNNYIVTSNCSDNSGLIKIYNFKGDLIKEIQDSNDKTYFIDVYYDNQYDKIYIITGNKGYVKSYDYYNNKLYKKYYDKDLSKSHDSVVVSDCKDNDELTKLIDSCQNGFISIWNFHSGLLLHKINIGYNYLEGICLWNENYLFVGGGDNSIKLIEIKNGLVIKSLTGHNENVLSIKKIKHKIYKECLISQGNDGIIKLWIYNNNN
jgi:WD40 repeat protein